MLTKRIAGVLFLIGFGFGMLYVQFELLGRGEQPRAPTDPLPNLVQKQVEVNSVKSQIELEMQKTHAAGKELSPDQVDSSVKGEIRVLNTRGFLLSPYGKNELLKFDGDLLDKLTFFIGDEGKSCEETCASITTGAFECVPGEFEYINQCAVLDIAFPEIGGSCEYDKDGQYSPGVNEETKKLVLGGDFFLRPPTCKSKAAHFKRLCPCGKPISRRGEDVTEKVRPLLAERLRIRHEVEKQKIEEKSAGGPVNMWEKKNYLPLWTQPASKMLTTLEMSSDYKILKAVDATCYDACMDHDLLCHRDWFDAFNDCDFLKKYFGAKSCNGESGRMSPRFNPSQNTVHFNMVPNMLSSSCGEYAPSHQISGERLCMCVTPVRRTAHVKDFHTVFNVQSSKYFEWQSRYGYWWHQKAKMPGRYTRLLSANNPDHLMSEVPTHQSPGYDFDDMWYVAYNKPLAVMNWLEGDRPKEQIVIVVDPDCMFVKPLNLVVEEGRPIAQTSFWVFEEHSSSVANEIAARYCADCLFYDPIAVPCITHIEDMRRIAPLWLKITEEIKADSHNWPKAWDDKQLSGITLGWTAEMFGYVFAAAKLGLRHDMWGLQNVPPVHQISNLPIIHYHVEVNSPGYPMWFKGNDNASSAFPDPVAPEAPQLQKVFFGLMKEARDAIGPYTNKTWRANYRFAEDSIHSIGMNVYEEVQSLIRNNKVKWHKGAPKVTADEYRDANVRIIVGDVGANCANTCSRESLVCNPQFFGIINRCNIITRLIPDGLYCAYTFFGPDLPAYKPSTYDILLNSNFVDYPTVCESSYSLNQRICPCTESKFLKQVSK